MIAPSQREKQEQVVNTLKRLALQQELDELADAPTLQMPVTPPSIPTAPPASATDNLPRIIEYPPPHMQEKYRPASIMAVLTEAAYYTKIKIGLIPATIYLNVLALGQYKGEAQRSLGEFDGSFHVLAAYGREERIILKLDRELGLTLPMCHVLCVCPSTR